MSTVYESVHRSISASNGNQLYVFLARNMIIN